MHTISASNENTEIVIKPKKNVQKVKKKSNKHEFTFSNTNEIQKEEGSTKLPKNSEEKLEKNDLAQSNKIGTISKQPRPKRNTKIKEEGKSFIVTSKDFPELKVSSSLSKFSAGNSVKIGFDKSWGNKEKKSETFPSLSPVIINTRSKTDICSEVDNLTESRGNHVAGLSDTNKEQNKIYLNMENSKENQEVPVQEATAQPKRNPRKKKRTDPIFINLLDISNLNENKTKTTSRMFRKSKFKRHKEMEKLVGNYLDSSNPRRLRGKHREVKKKRLTNLKLAIIKERIVKQKLREKATADWVENKDISFIKNIDFKTEIKVYLKELSERKKQHRDTTEKIIKKNSGNVNIDKEINSYEKNEKVNKIIPSISPDGNVKFTSKFREYCDNIITQDLNSAVSNLIKESVNLQDRSFLQDPIKARARKRHVSGIREVKKYLTLKRVKLIVIAPNLEKLQMEGNLYDVINDLKSTAKAQNVPYAFALDRYKLGRYTKKNLPVSAFAILTYEGIEGLFSNVMELLQEAKAQFDARVKANTKVEVDKTEEVNNKIISSFISAFQSELNISG